MAGAGQVLVQELEAAFIEKALEQKTFDPMFHTMEPAVVYLQLLKIRMGRDLTLEDLRQAVVHSRSMKMGTLNHACTIAGVASDLSIEFQLYQVHGKATVQAAQYRQQLRQFGVRAKPRISRLIPEQVHLTSQVERVKLENVGYGGRDEVQVTSLQHPSWLEVRVSADHRTLEVQALPLPGGHYRGQVRLQTNGGTVVLQVGCSSTHYPLPQENPILREALLPDHPDLDETATLSELGQLLEGLGYLALPGGMYLRPEEKTELNFTHQWLLSQDMLLAKALPALGYTSDMEFVDDENHVFHLQHRSGHLGGPDLQVMLELHEANLEHMKITAEPELGRMRVHFHEVEEWRALQGDTFLLTGTLQHLREPEVLSHLLALSEQGRHVDVVLSGTGEVPQVLRQQHRSGRLSLYLVAQHLPYRLYAATGSQVWYAPLPAGRKGQVSALPRFEGKVALEERDFRELSWRGDEHGLLDLELSVQMQQVQQSLVPMRWSETALTQNSSGVDWLDGRPHLQRDAAERVRTSLQREAEKAGVDLRPRIALPILKRLGLDAAHVVLYDGPVKLSRTGHLLHHRHRQTLPEAIRYCVQAYGGTLHHSQLRKLVEAYLGGRSLDSRRFINESLEQCGWGGNGYRRPREGWEPQSRQLPRFLLEVLEHTGSPEKANPWLQGKLFVPAPQLERAFSEAQALYRSRIEAAQKEQALKTAVPPVTSGTIKDAGVARTPIPAPAKPTLKLLPEKVLVDSAPDPRTVSITALQVQILSLVREEGPMTFRQLLARHAERCSRTPRLIFDRVLLAVEENLEAGKLQLESRPAPRDAESQVLMLPGQVYRLRESKVRSPEDVPPGEVLEYCRPFFQAGRPFDVQQVLDQARRHYRLEAHWKRMPEHLNWLRRQLERLMEGGKGRA
ncbi:hypothetical protein [Deinococcus roseus]|uniref:Uncharacterized protein n=1 Tax=Deinococcus roseus TaxID=392414 RepID=A0ABQ2CZK5_9DEIO|nr:hypothetical protein [Deinococcus roseus]GGJ36375.1 hypothetical protein GCM10008938_23080 [Deinococcus roseus]